MSNIASDVTVFRPTNELLSVFGEPDLVGSEKIGGWSVKIYRNKSQGSTTLGICTR
jgi:hypothetical protein